MYNYVHTSVPHYLSDIFTFTHDIHIHETTNLYISPFTSSNSLFLIKVH